MDNKQFYDVAVNAFSFLVDEYGFDTVVDKDDAVPFIIQVIFKGSEMALSLQRDIREPGLYPSVMRLMDGKVPQWSNDHILNLNLLLKQLDHDWNPPQIDWGSDKSQENALCLYAKAVKRWASLLFDPHSEEFVQALKERKKQFGV